MTWTPPSTVALDVSLLVRGGQQFGFLQFDAYSTIQYVLGGFEAAEGKLQSPTKESDDSR
jgi:hypothetical protein